MRWWKTKRALEVRAGAFTDTGQVRTQNQDNYGQYSWAAPDGRLEHLFVVADGMGGHEGGEEASRLAVETLRRSLAAEPGRAIDARLRRGFAEANAAIYTRGHANGTSNGRTMGTTCTALVLTGGRAHLAHVGDSRAYRIHHGRIARLTHDHTVAEDLAREGVLTPEEARRHPRRHTLSRALGTQREVEVDVAEAWALAPGETYLLCSDGLAPVADDEIRAVVEALPPQQACERLVTMANDRGGPDNVSVLVAAIA